jgi:two-component system OmpR family response regulator
VRAAVGTAALPLSTKEFALLRMLASRPNETLSRNDILTEVWGTTHHIDKTIVDQYVSYLRRKLEPLPSGVVISTVRGAGYVLREQE